MSRIFYSRTPEQDNMMDGTSTLELANSLQAEGVNNQSETILPNAPELKCVDFTKTSHKFLEEDYIPFAVDFTESKHNRIHGATDETQLCKAMLAERQQERRKRSEAEAQLLRQARIKREMARARKAANDTQNYSTHSLFGSNNDALVEELKIPSYAIKLVSPSEQDIIDQGVTCFAGSITIRPHLEAMEFALDEYNGCRKIPGRMTLWVDGSLSPRGVSGTAVVFRANPRVVGSKWVVRAYTILEFDRLGTIHTEALAIMHALRIALAKAILNDGTDAKASDVVIFSDSMSALHRIESFAKEGRSWGRPLLGRIATLANELTNLGVNVQLHWVPAHKSIPGNYLADVLAKRAARREIRERRYLSTGRG